jgi:hypothetical protein
MRVTLASSRDETTSRERYPHAKGRLRGLTPCRASSRVTDLVGGRVRADERIRQATARARRHACSERTARRRTTGSESGGSVTSSHSRAASSSRNTRVSTLKPEPNAAAIRISPNFTSEGRDNCASYTRQTGPGRRMPRRIPDLVSASRDERSRLAHIYEEACILGEARVFQRVVVRLLELGDRVFAYARQPEQSPCEVVAYGHPASLLDCESGATRRRAQLAASDLCGPFFGIRIASVLGARRAPARRGS